VLPGGGTTYIYYFRSFHDAKPVPPDIKSWRRHWTWGWTTACLISESCSSLNRKPQYTRSLKHR